MKIIAISNRKGGVGKTTTAANLGEIFANKGLKTLLIDLDDQSNLTNIFLKENPDKTIYEAFSGELDYIPQYKINECLYISPCTNDAAGLDIEISKKKNNYFILYNLLKQNKSNYDFIIIDCPPALSLININAFVAANEIFVVTEAELMPVNGLVQLENFLKKIEDYCGVCGYISKIIITKFRGNIVNNAVSELLINEYGNKVCKTKIRELADHKKANFSMQTIINYSPNSQAAKDYLNLAEEILNNIFNYGE